MVGRLTRPVNPDAILHPVTTLPQGWTELLDDRSRAAQALQSKGMHRELWDGDIFWVGKDKTFSCLICQENAVPCKRFVSIFEDNDEGTITFRCTSCRACFNTLGYNAHISCPVVVFEMTYPVGTTQRAGRSSLPTPNVPEGDDVTAGDDAAADADADADPVPAPKRPKHKHVRFSDELDLSVSVHPKHIRFSDQLASSVVPVPWPKGAILKARALSPPLLTLPEEPTSNTPLPVPSSSLPSSVCAGFEEATLLQNEQHEIPRLSPTTVRSLTPPPTAPRVLEHASGDELQAACAAAVRPLSKCPMSPPNSTSASTSFHNPPQSPLRFPRSPLPPVAEPPPSPSPSPAPEFHTGTPSLPPAELSTATTLFIEELDPEPDAPARSDITPPSSSRSPSPECYYRFSPPSSPSPAPATFTHASTSMSMSTTGALVAFNVHDTPDDNPNNWWMTVADLHAAVMAQVANLDAEERDHDPRLKLQELQRHIAAGQTRGVEPSEADKRLYKLYKRQLRPGSVQARLNDLQRRKETASCITAYADALLDMAVAGTDGRRVVPQLAVEDITGLEHIVKTLLELRRVVIDEVRPDS